MSAMDHAFIKAYGNDATPPVGKPESAARAYPTPAERNANLGRRQRFLRVDPAEPVGHAAPRPHADFADSFAEQAEGAVHADLRHFDDQTPLVDEAAPNRASQLERELQIEREMRIAREMQLEREIMFSREMIRQQDLREDVARSHRATEPAAAATPPAATPESDPHQGAQQETPRHMDAQIGQAPQEEAPHDAAQRGDASHGDARARQAAADNYVQELVAGGGVAFFDDSSYFVAPQLTIWQPSTEAAPIDPPAVATAQPVVGEEPAATGQPVAEPLSTAEPPTAATTRQVDSSPVVEPTHPAVAEVVGRGEPTAAEAEEPTGMPSLEEHAAAHAPQMHKGAHKEATPQPPRQSEPQQSHPQQNEPQQNQPPAFDKRKAAAWEVDRFVWPEAVQRLYQAEAQYFQHAGKKLRDASREGLCRLAVAGTQAGEGCTTLAICLARAAAAAGAKVAILDANLRRPELGDLFGLEFANSWHESLDGEVPLAEAAVTSLTDELTLIPLSWEAARWSVVLDDHRLLQLLDQAREVFDIVLVDLGSPFSDSPDCFGESAPVAFDAAIVVRDVRRTNEQETLETVARFKSIGVDAVGVAENFRSRQPARAAA